MSRALFVCLALIVGMSSAQAAAPAKSTAADKATPVAVSSPACDLAYSLVSLSPAQRRLMHASCERGPEPSAVTYAAMFRLVSSSGWHAGFIGTVLARHKMSTFSAWSDGRIGGEPSVAGVQQTLDDGMAEFSSGARCPDLRSSDALASFIEAIDVDEEPDTQPFTSRFAACMGVPDAAMEGIRLLTVRLDGLDDVTVAMGSRHYVHARRIHSADALRLGGHRLAIVAVPNGAPVAVFANHENQELPVMWRGLVNRNTVVWAAPPRRSCLHLSAEITKGTQLFVDGVRQGDADPIAVCPKKGGGDSRSIDRTIAVTLDRESSGLPDHEIAALTCEGGEPIVRHLSTVEATVPSERLRAAGDCEEVHLDLGTPLHDRVAVLGVTKMQSCENTPLWATDIQERVRHILSSDVAHASDRDYANFSAYAEASEALGALQSRLGPRGGTSEDTDDANTLLGSAAQEAWRQGIDTLLSFTVQCSPRGESEDGKPQWVYSIRATSIGVSGLFGRGYYGRGQLDLTEFIDVQSVGFRDPRQQDAAVGVLLDRVFDVDTPRFMNPPESSYYRDEQVVRVGGYYPGKQVPPETLDIAFRAFNPLSKNERRRDAAMSGPQGFVDPLKPGNPRPQVCDALVHRGARTEDGLAKAAGDYESLLAKERGASLQRGRGELDASADADAAVYEGPLKLPRPGWYLVVVKDGEEVVDAVCVHSSLARRPALPRREIWGDISFSGRPLAFATNGSRLQFRLQPELGVTWYVRRGWLGGGLAIGYAFSDFGGTRGDWRDLDVSVQEQQRWQRHALLVGPHVEVRTRRGRSPIDLWARFSPMSDGGFLKLAGVDDELIEFRGGNADDVVLDLDLDLSLQLGVSIPLGPINLRGFGAVTYLGVDDSLRRSATSVTEDGNLIFGLGLGVSGGPR